MLVNIAAVLADDAGLVPTMNISWVRGADGTIVGTARNSSGALLNLTGSTILLSVRTADSAAFPIFTRTGALTDAVNGIFTVTLTALDTDNLAAGAYRYDVWLTDNAGRHQIVKGSIFTLLESDTHVGEGATPVPPIYNGAVDTVNDGGVALSSVDASLLNDGAFMWVRRAAAGDIAPGAYFHIEIGTGHSVDHRTVEVALGLSGGQWVLTSTGGGGGGGGVSSVGSADGSVAVANPTTTPDISVRGIANWPIANIRVYAVDGVNGNDANAGFADAAGASSGQYATACAAAGAVAKKTIAGLAAIFPRVGNGRLVEIVIANGGVNTVGTYADGLGTIMSGAPGYSAFLVRGTGTQTTASAVAFDGSAADCAYTGAITAPGMNVAGYNPTGTPTAVSIACQLNGGGAAGFAAEAAATMPLGACVRFDSATTTAALRNVRAIVARVTGGNTLGFAAAALPAAPVTSDVFYIEQPGVSQPSLQLGNVRSGHLASQSTVPRITIAGIASTAASDVTASELTVGFCWFTSLTFTDSRLRTSSTYTHPVRGNITNTGLPRCSANFGATASSINFSGHAAGLYIITAPREHTTGTLVVGTGMTFTQMFGASSSVPTIGGTSALNGGVPSRVLDGGINLNGGGHFSVGQIETNTTAVSLFTVNGHNWFIDFSRAGANTSLTGNAAVAAALNMGTGSPIPANSVVRIDGNNLPAFTGALGQIYTTGLVHAITWAQAVGVGNGFRDGSGNWYTNNGSQTMMFNRFSGALFGDVGAVLTYLGDNPSVAANNTVPLQYPSMGHTASVLLVQPLVNTMAHNVTVTVYKNNVATSLVVTIPAGSLARVNASLGALNQYVSASTYGGADGDTFDLRMDSAFAEVGHQLMISATVGG